MVSSEKFNAPKLVNGSENRCSFIFDTKYDELRWFRLTRVTAYGMNVFRSFVKYLPGTKPAKRASANLHLNFPVENIDNRVRIIASVLSVMCCDNRLNRTCVADTHLGSCGNLSQVESNR